jgi:hypothetical protein
MQSLAFPSGPDLTATDALVLCLQEQDKNSFNRIGMIHFYSKSIRQMSIGLHITVPLCNSAEYLIEKQLLQLHRL